MDWRQARVRLTWTDGAVSYLAFPTVDDATMFVYWLPWLQTKGTYSDVWKALVMPLEVGCN